MPSQLTGCRASRVLCVPLMPCPPPPHAMSSTPSCHVHHPSCHVHSLACSPPAWHTWQPCGRLTPTCTTISADYMHADTSTLPLFDLHPQPTPPQSPHPVPRTPQPDPPTRPHSLTPWSPTAGGALAVLAAGGPGGPAGGHRHGVVRHAARGASGHAAAGHGAQVPAHTHLHHEVQVRGVLHGGCSALRQECRVQGAGCRVQGAGM